MNEEIKKQIMFVLEDDNEVMRSALDPDSNLDHQNKQMNKELIKKHEAILTKIEKTNRLTQEDLALIRDANEIHLNDEADVQGHHEQAVAAGIESHRKNSSQRCKNRNGLQEQSCRPLVV